MLEGLPLAIRHGHVNVNPYLDTILELSATHEKASSIPLEHDKPLDLQGPHAS